jgi:MFS family permease
MAVLAASSLACGLAQTEIHLIICRAIQGLGAAATVPSAIGVLSTYFVGRDRHRALSSFGAAGGVGFSVGLVLGGLVTGTIGWRYVFRITTPISALLAIAGWFVFPHEIHSADERKPALDVPGAALGTSGMILFTFALSSSDTYGWTKALVLAPLLVSIVVLAGFVWNEKKVQNPIMPMHLWRLPGFGAIWIAGFLVYCWWASMVY